MNASPTHTSTGAGATAAQIEVYLAHVCGYAAIRTWGDDEILHRMDGYSTYEKHLANARKIAARRGWDLHQHAREAVAE